MSETYEDELGCALVSQNLKPLTLVMKEKSGEVSTLHCQGKHELGPGVREQEEEIW